MCSLEKKKKQTFQIGSLYANQIFMHFLFRVASGFKGKLADRKKNFKPHGGLFYWPFYGGGPGVSLTLFILRRDLF